MTDTHANVPYTVQRDARLCLTALNNDVSDTEPINKGGVAYAPYVVFAHGESLNPRASAVLVFASPQTTAQAATADADEYLILYHVPSRVNEGEERAALRLPFEAVRKLTSLGFDQQALKPSCRTSEACVLHEIRSGVKLPSITLLFIAQVCLWVICTRRSRLQ